MHDGVSSSARFALLALCALLLAAPTLGADEEQDPRPLRWELGPHGAALFDRDHRASWNITSATEDRRPGWYRTLNAPVVFADELDEEARFLAASLRDIRDLPLWLAADLRFGLEAGRVERTFDSLRRFTPFRAMVAYGPPDAEGFQDVVGFLRPLPVEPKPRMGGAWTPTGRIRIRRRIDPASRRLTTFESTLTLTCVDRTKAPKTTSDLEIVEHWTWRRDARPGDSWFKRRVATAIAAAMEDLKRKLELDAFHSPSRLMGPLPAGQAAEDSERPGFLALTLLALLRAGADPEDRIIARALDELRSRDIQRTYSLATAIMAIEARYAPVRERERLIDGTLKEPIPRTLPAKDLALVGAWTDRLLQQHDTRVDSGYELRWRYRPAPDYDNSNTQYALLGLYSAHLCGVRIPRHVWMACAAHWLRDAQPWDEEAFRLSLVTHAERKEQEKKPITRSVAAGRKVQPSMWGYTGAGGLNGSMTAGGISSLTICLSAIRGSSRTVRRARQDIEKAILGGFAYFGRAFTVRDLPGPSTRLGDRLYYLYGLERACELNRVSLLHGRDWYFEGAVWLVENQHEDGSWGRLTDTAFALLFLKRSTLPVVTAPP